MAWTRLSASAVRPPFSQACCHRMGATQPRLVEEGERRGVYRALTNGQGDRRRQEWLIIPIHLRVSHGQLALRLARTRGRARGCSRPRSPERSCR